MNEQEGISFDKAELRSIMRAYKALDEQAQEEAKKIGHDLAALALQEIQNVASPEPARARIANNGKVVKSSKVGELAFGFQGGKYSGGGTTKELWPGYEFGSDRFKQFAPWSGRYGRGSRGKFIYPTLRRLQPEYAKRWTEAMSRVMRKW